MCPRLRTIPDAAIADLACGLLIEQGPDAVTFAQVSQRCGLAPPTLVQRFASRTGLLEGVAGALRGRLAAAFRSGTTTASPLSGLDQALQVAAPAIAAALRLSPFVALDGFAMDLRKQISYGFAAAVEAGELPRCDVAQLARTVQISVTGAVATALLEQGDVQLELGRALQEQLASFI